MSNHHEKIEEEIQRLSAEFISRESNRQSLVTVTHVSVTEDSKRALIFLSVMPENKEEEVLHFAKRKRAEMRDYVKEHLKSRIIPFLDVVIDEGEKHRQKIDRLMQSEDFS